MIEDDEALSRFVLQSSHIRKTSGTVKPDAFIPHPHSKLSVTRHQGFSSHQVWQAGVEVASQTRKTLHGRADTAACIYYQQNLSATEAPVPRNENHVNIDGWPTGKPEQKIVALEIAAESTFLPREG